MNISGTNPIDGGGKIPHQPIDPQDGKGGSNNNSKVVPTTSQDMAAVLAQTGQIFYVPAQIIPGDEGRDVKHDSHSNKFNAKHENKTVIIDNHPPRTTAQFNNLLNQFNTWMSQEQHSNSNDLPNLQGQMLQQGAEVIDDDYLANQPVTFTQTDAAKGDGKVSDHLADFMETFGFSDMGGTKGLVAWALMMNYLKSAIWSSALTATDVEALMQQFKAMIEQLKASADAKKLLAEKQSTQIENQAEILGKEGKAALQMKMCGIWTQVGGTFLDGVGSLVREGKGALMKRQMEDKDAKGKVAATVQADKIKAENIVWERNATEFDGHKLESELSKLDMEELDNTGAKADDKYAINLELNQLETKSEGGKLLPPTTIRIKGSEEIKRMESRENINEAFKAQGFDTDKMKKAHDEKGKEDLAVVDEKTKEALIKDSHHSRMWLTKKVIDDEYTDYGAIAKQLYGREYKELLVHERQRVYTEARIRVAFHRTISREYDAFKAAPTRERAIEFAQKIYRQNLYGNRLNTDLEHKIIKELKDSYGGIDFDKPELKPLSQQEREDIELKVDELNPRLIGAERESKIKNEQKVKMIGNLSREELQRHGIDLANLDRIIEGNFTAEDTVRYLNRKVAIMDGYVAGKSPGNRLLQELTPQEINDIAQTIDREYPDIAVNERDARIMLEQRKEQIMKTATVDPDLFKKTGINRADLESIVNESFHTQALEDSLEQSWVDRFTNQMVEKISGRPGGNMTPEQVRAFGDKIIGTTEFPGSGTRALHKIATEVKSFEKEIDDLQKLPEIERRVHNETLAALDHRKWKKLEILNQVAQIVAKYAETQGDKLALTRDVLTKYSESYQTMLRGQSDSSTAVLDGMLQLMQKILDALVQLQQSLRQTATQATGSMAISTF